MLLRSFVFIDILALFAKNITRRSAFTSSHAVPGWRRPRFVGARCPEGTGQAERHNLTARSVRAGARPILAYKFRCGLPRSFPAAGYLGASTDTLKGWRGPEHLRAEPQSPNTRDSDALPAPSRGRKDADHKDGGPCATLPSPTDILLIRPNWGPAVPDIRTGNH